jgi:tetratricopeptide (TPR) repeat protein
MRLNIINQFSIETGTDVVRRLRTRKTEELLVFLALHQTRWVARTELLEQIWPDDEDQAARQKLRLALHSIRSVIGSKLESDGDLVKVKDIEVDFNEADLLNLPPGWRLMPGHEVEWLDLIAASGEARQQLSTLSQLETTTDKANSLAYLISTDPSEPSLYQDLFDHYTKQGSRAAASVVASFARLNLGRNCPPELSQTSKSQIRSDFVGRLRELATLAEALLGNQEPAVIQLNGVGGMGKTRLASELASLAPAEDIPVAWVSLDGVTNEHDAKTKLQAVLAEALSITPEEAKAPPEISSILVILDNADQALLGFLQNYQEQGCGLRVLITSQTHHPEIGRSITVQPLSLPRGNSLDQAHQSEAINLLTFLSGKPLNETNHQTYQTLAEESGGVPLALAMIAAEARHRPLGHLAESLRSKSMSLKFGTGNEAIPIRHLSLEATLQWSFDLLSPEERRAAAALSANEEDFDRKILAPLGISEETLRTLLNSNWVTEPAAEGVFRLLPPVRNFLRFRSGPETKQILKDWLVHQISENYPADYAAVGEIAERYQADIALFERDSDQDPAETQGALLVGLQITAHRYGRVEHFLTRMSALLEKQEHPNWRNLLGSTEYIRRNYSAALSHFEQLLSATDSELKSVAKVNIALIKMSTGDPEQANRLLTESIEETTKVRRKGARMINRASCYCLLGEYETAVSQANQALELFETDGTLPAYIALCHQRRAEAELLLNQTSNAKTSALLALDGFEESRQWHHMVELYMLLTLIAATEQDLAATKKWGQLLLDQKPDPVALCGTLYHALKRLNQPNQASQFSAGFIPENLPLLLKSLPKPNSNPNPQARSVWYAIARQTLKHL